MFFGSEDELPSMALVGPDVIGRTLGVELERSAARWLLTATLSAPISARLVTDLISRASLDALFYSKMAKVSQFSK